MIEPQSIAWTLGGVAGLLAVPGVLSRRCGPFAVRLAALTALAGVWVAALDLKEHDTVVRARHLVAATTGATDAAWIDERRRALAELPPVGRLDVVAAVADVASAVVAARLTARDEASVVLVWDGAFAPAGIGARGAARAFTTVPPPPIEPADLELRALGALEVDRPGALEVRLRDGVDRSELPVGLPLTVSATLADGPPEELASTSLDLLQTGPIRVDWTPGQAGVADLTLTVEGPDGLRVTAHGRVPVAPQRAGVLVLGSGAPTIVAALIAQGVTAAAAEAVPPTLDAEVVVVLGPLPDTDQERLASWVDDGGGVLLVGGAEGGGLPSVGQPLDVLSPFERLPTPEPVEDQGGDGPGDEPRDDAGAPRGENAYDEPAGPPPPRDTPPDAPPPDGPPSGDTEAATDQPPELAEVDRRRIALVLVIDRSGSMNARVRGGASRMDLAKASAFETARQLESDDELGIIAFNEFPTVYLPLARLPVEAALRQVVETIRADGGTQVGRATAEAGKLLARSDAPVRHAIVFTDGDTLPPGDALRAQAAAKRMADQGVTVSLIQVADRPGRAADVKRIADLGRGKFVRSIDGASIPRLILAEVRRVLGAAGRRPEGEGGEPGDAPGEGTPPGERPEGYQKPIGPDPEERTTEPDVEPPTPPDEPPRDEPDPATDTEPATPEGAEDEASAALRVVAIGDSAALEPRPEDGFPDLFGVTAVDARSAARVLLAVADGTPLLAFANHGLGRVGAWSSDWSGPWSSAWRDDPSFPARLATWVRFVAPADAVVQQTDVIEERAIDPAAPVRAEREWIATVASGGLQPIEAFDVPGPEVIEVEVGQAEDHALLALGTLLALALVEWFLRRRGVGGI